MVTEAICIIALCLFFICAWISSTISFDGFIGRLLNFSKPNRRIFMLGEADHQACDDECKSDEQF